MIKTVGLQKLYRTDEVETTALDNVNIEVFLVRSCRNRSTPLRVEIPHSKLPCYIWRKPVTQRNLSIESGIIPIKTA